MYRISLVLSALLLAVSSTQVHAEKTRRHVDNLVQHILGQKESYITGIPVAPAIVETDNFAIHYIPHQFAENRGSISQLVDGGTIPQYITDLMAELEFSFSRIKKMGFPDASFAQQHLISVFVVSPDRFAKDVLASVQDFTLSSALDSWPRGSYIALPNNLSSADRRSTIAHEVFHIFQDIPRFEDSKPLNWLLESTATWSEDEIHAPTDPHIGYPIRLHDAWWREWGTLETPFIGLDHQRDNRNKNVWYSSAVLFKWWTENLAIGNNLVAELLGPELTSGNAKQHLVNVLKRHAPPNSAFPDLFLDATLASYLLTGPEPYALKRGKEVVKQRPRETIGGPFSHETYDSLTGKIQPETVRIPSFAAYFQRVPAEKMAHASEAKPLFISVTTKDPGAVRFAFVEHSSRFPDRRRVTEISPGSYVIPRFANDLDETLYVDLVAVNGDVSNSTEIDWSFSVGGPPILEKVRIESSGKEIYQASWQPPQQRDEVLDWGRYSANSPGLQQVTNQIPEEMLKQEALRDTNIQLTFSQPVALREVSLGDTEIQHTQQGVRDYWELSVERVPLNLEPDSNQELTLSVNAWNGDAMRLDAKPDSRAALNDNGRTWFAYEGQKNPNRGGVDQNHIINRQPGTSLVSRLKIAGKVIVPKTISETGEDIPVEEAQVYGVAAYYSVEEKLAERFIELTKQMAPLADLKATRTAEDEDRWLALYEEFVPVLDKVEQQAKFLTGHSPGWRTTTDTEGMFNLSHMPSPGNGGIIAACYGFWAHAKDHNNAISGETFSTHTIDYFGYKAYEKRPTAYPVSDMRIRLAHQGRLPHLADQEGKTLSYYELGDLFTGDQLNPPLRPGWLTSTYLIKPRLDNAWIKPIKFSPQKTAINTAAVNKYNQCLNSASKPSRKACFDHANGIGFGLKSSAAMFPVEVTTGFKLSHPVSEYQTVYQFTRVPTVANMNSEGRTRSGPEHRRQLAVGGLWSASVRENSLDYRCKPTNRADIFRNIRIYYAPISKKREILYNLSQGFRPPNRSFSLPSLPRALPELPQQMPGPLPTPVPSPIPVPLTPPPVFSPPPPLFLPPVPIESAIQPDN